MAQKFPHSYEVCNCKHVTLGEIIFAIKEKGAKSIEEATFSVFQGIRK